MEHTLDSKEDILFHLFLHYDQSFNFFFKLNLVNKSLNHKSKEIKEKGLINQIQYRDI